MANARRRRDVPDVHNVFLHVYRTSASGTLSCSSSTSSSASTSTTASEKKRAKDKSLKSCTRALSST